VNARAFACLLALGSLAHADPTTTLRLATLGPDGTPWAREFKAWARDVEAATSGRVVLKIYYGGIAGDELKVIERIQRGQLDGSMSGGALCQKLAPAMRVAGIEGLFQSRDEASHVIRGLYPVLDEEFRRAGFVNLGTGGVGSVIAFTDQPVRTLADLQRLKLGRWEHDEVGLLMDRAIGIQSVPTPPEAVAKQLEARAFQGILTTPTVLLAFQMYPHVRYFLDLRINYFSGCVALATRAFDLLSVDDRASVRAATAKLMVRFEEASRHQDDALLGGVLAKQGVQPLPVSPQLRSEFLAAARLARQRLGEQLVPAAVLQRALNLLADYRAEHPIAP
jgi:TRAP-type transport system periplasmic protein